MPGRTYGGERHPVLQCKSRCENGRAGGVPRRIETVGAHSGIGVQLAATASVHSGQLIEVFPGVYAEDGIVGGGFGLVPHELRCTDALSEPLDDRLHPARGLRMARPGIMEQTRRMPDDVDGHEAGNVRGRQAPERGYVTG